MYNFQPPLYSQIPKLRQLWKDTFGDSDAFLDMFFETAFSFERCTCVTSCTYLVASLYWFDCEFLGQKIAYIYAVATAKEYRGQGICHALMEYTHAHLKAHGYAGAILSPAEESLFSFYGKMGYQTCVYTKEITTSLETNIICENTELNIRQISKEEFAQLRRTFLPQNAVIQENENLDFLEKQAIFYTGENFLFTAQVTESDCSESFPMEKHLHGIEFLGDKSKIPHILNVLGYASCSFRTIGSEKPFGMYLSFSESGVMPSYLGFAFD